MGQAGPSDERPAEVAEPPRARHHLPLRVRAGGAVAIATLVLTSALAFVAYQVVRSSLLGEREDAAERQAYTNARLLRTRIDPIPDDMAQLLAGLQVGGSGDSLLRVGDSWFTSSVQITGAELPESLAETVEGGDAGIQRFDRFGTPALAVGVPIASADAGYFEVTSLAEVDATLSRLGRLLLVAAAVATVIGGALGAMTSAAILRPLRQFALVAERITSGGSTSAGGSAGSGDPAGPGGGDGSGGSDGTTGAEPPPGPSRLDAAGDSDLEPLATSFNEMLDELDQRIERERRFASEVSHEIRGPVAALASAVSVIDRRRDRLPEDLVPIVDALQAQVQQFNQLVLDLLEIARFDARNAQLDTAEIELVSVVTDVARTRGHDGIQVSASAPVPLEADRRRLEQVVANLLENAQRYAGGATDLDVEAIQVDGATPLVQIRVHDRGPGVAPAEREAIFGRFERGRAADEAPGTGLGLALSREHIALHGGRIWVQDRAGGGATFVVEMPAVQR